jgi:DNA-binding XRE family transcriptional regulator
MKEHINYQILKQNGRPMFAVILYSDFQTLLEQPKEESNIPHKIAKMIAIDEVSPIKAWRIYLRKTQAELAFAIGVKQPAITQMERQGAKLHNKTLKKIAAALGITENQLIL